MVPFKTRVLLSCLVGVVAWDSANSFDFTPSFARSTVNDHFILRPFFVNGKTRYGVTLPTDTTLAGNSSEADFSFNKLDGARFRIKESLFKPEAPFQGETLATYRKAALVMAVAGASKVMIESEKAGPLAINDWSSYTFVLLLETPGRRFKQEIVFLNISPTEQWILLTSATEKRFEEATSLSLDIMRSWRPVPHEEDMNAPLYP